MRISGRIECMPAVCHNGGRNLAATKVGIVGVAELIETMQYGPAPEAAGPALAWIEEHGPEFNLFIDGDWRAPAEGAYFESLNPATAKPLARIAQAGSADVDLAVDAARRAQPA